MKLFPIAVFIMAMLPMGCVKSSYCDCKAPDQLEYLKAKVVQTSDIACGKPVLDFSEDSVRVRALSENNSLLYVVINLPSSFNVKDKKLYVLASRLKPEEEFACTAVGPFYPRLKIVNAKNRD